MRVIKGKNPLCDWDTYLTTGFTRIYLQSEAKLHATVVSHFYHFFGNQHAFMLKPGYRTELKIRIQAGNTLNSYPLRKEIRLLRTFCLYCTSSLRFTTLGMALKGYSRHSEETCTCCLPLLFCFLPYLSPTKRQREKLSNLSTEQDLRETGTLISPSNFNSVSIDAKGNCSLYHHFISHT